MRTLACSRYTLSIGLVSALLTACGGSQALIGAPTDAIRTAERVAPQLSGFGTVFALTTSGKETVLHKFGFGSTDGARPRGGLLYLNGTLYGVTETGGSYNGGTVFAITPSGTETVLHSFGSSGDGSDPEGGLVNVSGTLYGTAAKGGENDYGVVFAITRSGKESVVYSFKGTPGAHSSLHDAEYPTTRLLNVNGTLYGTTLWGGTGACTRVGRGPETYGCGTVFEVATSGKESVLFNFPGWRNPSETLALPNARLVAINRTLYGTEVWDKGKIFSVTTSGKEKMVYAFKGDPSDGADSYGGLVEMNGVLFGSTTLGGASNLGTIFSVTTSGAEKELYSFSGGVKGGQPNESLTDVNGTLYSTVPKGGAHDAGAVFAITTSGSERLVYSFKGDPNDGKTPDGGLVNVKGTLYGTTDFGGV
jgi:uncharacterized repeat protein (TIGR03803 family)